MTTQSRVVVSREGAVAHVQLNRPEKRNGLDMAMFEELISAGVSLKQDHSLRAIVLSGAGPVFCAGLDFASFMSTPGSIDRLLERNEDSPANQAQRAAWVWQEIPVPVIAAVHGVALGAGLQIASGADIRITHPETRFSIMEIKWGIIPDMGITKTLAGIVPRDVLKELTFTGRIFTAKEALQMGFCTRISENPLDEAMALATQIAEKNPHAIRAAKTLWNTAPQCPVEDALKRETELQVPILGSPNQMEAVMANFQKRTPDFANPESSS